MTSKYRLQFSAFILFILISGPIFAQDGEIEEPEYQKVDLYGLGDQTFSINAGLYIPLFLLDISQNSTGVAATQMTVGGVGSLSYEAYLNNNIKLGLEVGGMFANDLNEVPFFMIPITGKIAYEFHFGQFNMPIYMGMGINIITYKELTNVQFLLKPGISLYWNFNSNWSFGGNLVYWLPPEIVFADHSQDRLGNYLDFTLSAQYHF